MAAGVTISGFDGVLGKMNKAIMGIEGRSLAGVLEAGLVVKRRSMQLTPVETGNLRGGCQLASTGTGKSPRVTIYYQAAYAPFVHEVENAKSGKKVYHKPPTQWKFLETAMKEKAKEIVEIIRKRAHL